MRARFAALARCGLAVLAAWATVARAESGDGVVAVPTPTGTDPASLARRVELLEDRLQALWSLRQGPDVLAVDTVDRLATRLLAAEARLAVVETATGVREARAHAHGGGAFEVALAALLVGDADWRGEPAEQLRLRQVVRAAPWPKGLQAKAGQLDAAWTAAIQARSAGDEDALGRRAAELEVIRRDLRLAAGNWVASLLASEGAGHDHSGAAAGAHADHSPHHGGQVAMKGDVHVELASEREGRWLVYLTDAFRQPLPVAGWEGEIVLFPDADDERAVPLADAGEALAAEAGAAARVPVDVRVRLVAPAGLADRLGPAAVQQGSRDVEVDFQFLSEGPGGTGDPVPVHPPDCPMAPREPAAAGAARVKPRWWR